MIYDGGKKRDEEPEQEEPPKFYKGPDPFTVAIWEEPHPTLKKLPKCVTDIFACDIY